MTYSLETTPRSGSPASGSPIPHTSGRVKAFQRMPNAKLLGAYDDSPLLAPVLSRRWASQARSKEEILADPNVHAVLIHPKSYLMADWAIEAMEAGKAVLCEKPAGRGSDRHHAASSRRSSAPASSSRSATAGVTRRRWTRCRRS